MINPKKDFLATTDAKLLADLVDSTWFKHALAIALSQMTVEMASAESPAKSWDYYSQISGAKRLIQVILDLPDPKIVEKKKLSGTLNYDT